MQSDHLNLGQEQNLIPSRDLSQNVSMSDSKSSICRDEETKERKKNDSLEKIQNDIEALSFSSNTHSMEGVTGVTRSRVMGRDNDFEIKDVIKEEDEAMEDEISK